MQTVDVFKNVENRGPVDLYLNRILDLYTTQIKIYAYVEYITVIFRFFAHSVENVCRKEDKIAGVEEFTDDHLRDMGVMSAGLTDDEFRKLDKVRICLSS